MHDLFAFALFGQLTTTFQQKIERERERERQRQNEDFAKSRRSKSNTGSNSEEPNGMGRKLPKIRGVHLSIPKSVVHST